MSAINWTITVSGKSMVVEAIEAGNRAIWIGNGVMLVAIIVVIVMLYRQGKHGK